MYSVVVLTAIPKPGQRWRTKPASCPLLPFVAATVQRQVVDCSSHSGDLATECSSALCGALHKADEPELILWQVSECSSHSDDGFRKMATGGSWPYPDLGALPQTPHSPWGSRGGLKTNPPQQPGALGRVVQSRAFAA